MYIESLSYSDLLETVNARKNISSLQVQYILKYSSVSQQVHGTKP